MSPKTHKSLEDAESALEQAADELALVVSLLDQVGLSTLARRVAQAHDILCIGKHSVSEVLAAEEQPE